MAYSRVEQAYIDGVADYQFPDPVIEEPAQEQPMMLADSGKVKSDAQPGFGTIGPIPRNKAQEALGYVGELLTKAGVQLDKVGLDVPILGRITLKDLTVGESGRVLEDMSYGFMPVEGAGGFISGTTRIKPDEALELLNIAPVVGAAAKVGGKAVTKGITQAVEATKGLPVGMSVKPVGQGVDELGFFSAATKAVDNIQQPKGTGAQFLAQIEKTPGVKPEEIKWTGLDDFLKSKKTVTKQEVQEYLAANRVEVKEKQLGAPSNPEIANQTATDIREILEAGQVLDDDADNFLERYYRARSEGRRDLQTEASLEEYLRNAGDLRTVDEIEQVSRESAGDTTKFSNYTLPGGENYREILLTLPSKNPEFDPKDLSRLTDLSNKTRTAAEDVEYKALAQRYDASLRGETSPQFKSQHFDQPNILAHLRVNDRVDADGKKVLFVEEVQSDWHQAGRKKGYETKETKAAMQKKIDELEAERNQLYAEQARLEKLAEPFTSQGKDAPPDILDQWNMVSNRLNNLSMEWSSAKNYLATGGNLTPDAPFKTTWHELALKRAIQMAAEGGYDRIAFTTGAQQAARYDLSKQVKAISYKDGKLQAYDANGALVINKDVAPNNLDEYVGKELGKTMAENAQKAADARKAYRDAIKNDAPESELERLQDAVNQSKTEYTGVDLQIGGEGMKGFYDNIVPKFLDKYGKKWDAKTGMTEINVAGGKPTDYADFNEYVSAKGGKTVGVHYIDITPKMKESVLTQGQPLFAIGAGGAGAAMQQEEKK